MSNYSLFISKFSTIPPTPNQPTNTGNLNNNFLYDSYKNDRVLNNIRPNMHASTSVNNALPLTHTPNYITHFGYYQNCRSLRIKLKYCNLYVMHLFLSIFVYVYLKLGYVIIFMIMK